MTHLWIRNHCLFCAVTLLTFCAAAQSDTDNCQYRPVTSVFTAGVGPASSLDSYLSDVSYTGINASLGYEHLQATGFSPRRWVRQLAISADFRHMKNPARNRKAYTVGLTARWGMMHRWSGVFTPGLSLFAGASTGIDCQVEYRPSNSNNLLAVHAEWDVGATAMAVYNTRLRNTPVSLRYQAEVPVVGVLYSPQYDESYYEMYVGNRSGLAHFASWGCRFAITNSVFADFRLGSTILRIGYQNRYYSSSVSHISYRRSTHSFIVGVGGEFLSMGTKRPVLNSASAIY